MLKNTLHPLTLCFTRMVNACNYHTHTHSCTAFTHMKKVGDMGGAMLSLSSYNLRGKDSFLSFNNKVVICWRSRKHLGTHTPQHLLTHGFLSHIGAEQQS